MLSTQTETSAARGLTDLFCNPRYYAPPPGALPYQHFWEVWNRAVRLIRRLQPDATIVGPSIAPGPGSTANAGIDPEHATKAQWLASQWSPQKAWLLEFLSQAHANGTVPDLISWHDYTGEPEMAVRMRSEVRDWMKASTTMASLRSF